MKMFPSIFYIPASGHTGQKRGQLRSGAGPLPFVTDAPPRRASGAGQTAAPKAGHSPVAEP